MKNNINNRLTKAGALLAVTTSSILSTQTIYANSINTMEVEMNVKVREGDSVLSNELGFLPKGTVVEGVKVGSWFRINYNGKEAYVSYFHLKPLSTQLETMYVKGGVNVRASNTVKSKKLGHFNHGSKLNGKSVGSWFEIDYHGQKAYVSKKHIIKNKIEPASSVNATTTANMLNVRSGPGMDYPVIAKLEKGSSVSGHRRGSWFKISYGGHDAYVHSKYINTSGVSENETDEETLKVKYDYVNVRTGPSTNNYVITTLQRKGTVFTGVKEGNWFKTIYNGQQAYISYDLLEPITDIDAPDELEESNNPPLEDIDKEGKITLNNNYNGYVNALNAKNQKNAVKIMEKGEYYIYKEFDGMTNITKKKGQAGAWVNLEKPIIDKVDEESTETEKNTIVLKDRFEGFLSAQDAKTSTNPVKTFQKGKYFIYKTHNNMINISLKENVPGAWINPDNPYKEIESNNGNGGSTQTQTPGNHNTIYTDSKKMLLTGSSLLTENQMVSYIKRIYPNAPQLVYDLPRMYLEEGRDENIRGDIAFAQALLETGNFKFPGSKLSLYDYNFAGIGAVGGGVKGNEYDTPRGGVRVQIQHLKAYANNEPLVHPLIDSRFKYVKRGSASNLMYLGIQENPGGYGWAAGAGYGDKIMRIYNGIASMPK